MTQPVIYSAVVVGRTQKPTIETQNPYKFKARHNQLDSFKTPNTDSNGVQMNSNENQRQLRHMD